MRLRDALVEAALQPRKLAKSLHRFLPETAPQALAVMALDSQWLKLLQVEGPPRHRRITKLLALPVEGRSPGELSALLTEHGVGGSHAPNEVLIATPTHLCTARLFTLPSIDEQEIRDIVELQAEKHTPYAKEEILTDFLVMHRDASGYSRILLVIVHQDVVNRVVHVVESSGLPLDRVGCELEGLLNWFQLAKRSGGAGAASGPSLVVEIDGSTTTVLVVQQKQLLFHRSLATGAEQLQQDSTQAGERLLGEIQRSLEALELEGAGTKIQDVWLTGPVERLSTLKSLIERAVNVPVTLASPWAEQPLSEAAQVVRERLPEVSFASLVGLACAPSTLDVTPQTTKLRHAFEAKAKALVLLGCQGIAALILLSILFIGRAQKEQWYARALRTVYHQSAQEASRVEAAIRQVTFVKERLRQRGQLLGAVEALATRTTPEIQWESIVFTVGEGIILKGTTAELPKVYEFVAALDAAELFGRVEARRVTKRKSGEEGLTEFEVVCPFAT